MENNLSLQIFNKHLIIDKTICTLNGSKNTCLPNHIIDVVYKKTIDSNENPNLSNKKLIIDKISKDCGCDNQKNINNKELCILKNIDTNILDKDMSDCLIYTFFKPEGSHNGNDWLNNTHVDMIQEQLYRKFPDYSYSFIHMIDNVMIPPKNMKCINHPVKSITDINFIDLIQKNNIKWHGIVFNTDPSHKSGQHWFCILFNFTTSGNKTDPYLIEYFNSSGFNINNNEFKEYLENLALNIWKNTGKDTILKTITNIQHQNENTGNCGIYAIYYIWSRLSGVSMESFNNPNNKITDNTMEDFRKVLFRKDE